MVRAQLTPPGKVYGMPSTPETGRLVCTGAVSRLSAARGSIPVWYARSERRPEKCPVFRFSAARGSMPIFYTRRYRHLGKCAVCHRRPRQDIWRARVQYLVLVPHGVVYRYVTPAVISTWGSVQYTIGARDMACTSAVCRYRAARGSIPICYACSERHPGKFPACPS